MNPMYAAVKTFVDDEDGVTAIEYGLIAAAMAVAITVAFTLVGDGLQAAFTSIKTKLLAA